MAAAQCISRLGACEGYEVESDEEVRRAGAVWCVIRLKPMTQVLRCCSGCGEWVETVHDLQTRHVRNLPIFEIPVELVVPRVRLLCPRCGPKLKHSSWLEPYSRSTVRLEKSAARLCKVMSVRHVALFYGLAWTAVKRIDKRYLRRELGPIDLDGVRVIAMDEFAIHYIAARILVAAMSNASTSISGATVRASLERLNFDMGGLQMGYAQQQHTALRFLDLGVVSEDERLIY